MNDQELEHIAKEAVDNYNAREGELGYTLYDEIITRLRDVRRTVTERVTERVYKSTVKEVTRHELLGSMYRIGELSNKIGKLCSEELVEVEKRKINLAVSEEEIKKECWMCDNYDADKMFGYCRRLKKPVKDTDGQNCKYWEY